MDSTVIVTMLHYRTNANAALSWPKVDRPTNHLLFVQDACFLFIFILCFLTTPMSQYMLGCYKLDPLCSYFFLLIC